MELLLVKYKMMGTAKNMGRNQPWVKSLTLYRRFPRTVGKSMAFRRHGFSHALRGLKACALECGRAATSFADERTDQDAGTRKAAAPAAPPRRAAPSRPERAPVT